MKHVHRPCNECPWRADSEPGRFARERWDSLAASSVNTEGFGPTYGEALFACHKTPDGKERACAGWLVQEGANHPNVRLAVMTGKLPMCALSPGEDWPDLHPDFLTTRAHDLEDSDG
jgi:hypothetical protein